MHSNGWAEEDDWTDVPDDDEMTLHDELLEARRRASLRVSTHVDAPGVGRSSPRVPAEWWRPNLSCEVAVAVWHCIDGLLGNTDMLAHPRQLAACIAEHCELPNDAALLAMVEATIDACRNADGGWSLRTAPPGAWGTTDGDVGRGLRLAKCDANDLPEDIPYEVRERVVAAAEAELMAQLVAAAAEAEGLTTCPLEQASRDASP
eukprot:gene48770-34634_t